MRVWAILTKFLIKKKKLNLSIQTRSDYKTYHNNYCAIVHGTHGATFQNNFNKPHQDLLDNLSEFVREMFINLQCQVYTLGIKILKFNGKIDKINYNFRQVFFMIHRAITILIVIVCRFCNQNLYTFFYQFHTNFLLALCFAKQCTLTVNKFLFQAEIDTKTMQSNFGYRTYKLLLLLIL